jgi:superfamily II DNA or RNA helicase
MNFEKNLSDIHSWDNFFDFANSLTEKQKGGLFEKLTYLILKTKPEYSSILKNVWIHNREIPKEICEQLNLPDLDEGIDLIAETFRGEFWAIQCKFKGQNQSPTYKELSTFTYLANTYCKRISLALLVHTGEKGVKKRHLMGERYSEIGLDFWLNLTSEDWDRIHKKIKGQTINLNPRIPRPHQAKAIESAQSHFLKLKKSRGRLIMPCGTGKSLTSFWIADTINARSVIIAVPSLGLIKQSLEDWTREFVASNENPKPDWLVICSDESTGNLEKDEFVGQAYSLGIPTTTKVEVITDFLREKNKGKKIVFTTYQSSERLAEAAQKCGFKFELALLDEAHKTVGEKSKSFSILLSDENIKIDKRIFMTATERVVKGEKENVYSMDNDEIYGERVFQMTFKEAIHSKPPIICDYKILTITVSSTELQQLINQNNLISDHSKNLGTQESQSLAAAIVLRKATEKYGIKHAISFHKSIKTANDFAILNRKLNLCNIDKVNFVSSHISGNTSAGERIKLIKNFQTEDLALITNARCLTEGIDIPAVDCVLFVDPKQSLIDIVQATGRALRPYMGKKYGYIILPLIVPDGIEFENFFESTPFREISRILMALSTQDERIAEEFRIFRKGKKFEGKRIIIESSIPVGLNISVDEFSNKIRSKIWEKVAKINWRNFSDAKNFVHSLQLKKQFEWREYAKSKDKPEDIPADPPQVYKNKGWKSFGDWLGTGTIAARLRIYRPYSEAIKFSHSLGLKSNKDWQQFSKSKDKPDDIPSDPGKVYKNDGWKSLGEWLGTGVIAPRLRNYKLYDEAKQFVHSLGLKSYSEWLQYCKSGKRPVNIPALPQNTYKGKGWIGFGDWLGTGVISFRKRSYMPFEEAKQFVHALNLKNSEEWKFYCKSENMSHTIPKAPDQYYKNKGWKNWKDWLGTYAVYKPRKNYLPFEKARFISRHLSLKSVSEWFKYYKSKKDRSAMPSNPAKVYKYSGWISWGDWLGIANEKIAFISFNDAKRYVHTLKFKNKADWRQYCRSGKKPLDIPYKPETAYKNKGWTNYSDWLGSSFIGKPSRDFLSFSKAKMYARKLHLKSHSEWNEYCKSKKKPLDIPSNPNQIYKHKGWKNWGDWLGTGNISNSQKARQFKSSKKAK